MKIDPQYLDGRYTEKNPTFHVEDSFWKSTQILNGIRKHNIRCQTVAEVGCGAGEILVQLGKKLRDSTFIGYELSPQAFEMCMSRSSERIRFLNRNILEDDKFFDLILCIDVIEHIEDYFSFLRGLSGKARSFIFHIPLDMNVQMVARSAPILGVREHVGHLHYFSKDTALATLSECGYQVIGWDYTPIGLDLPKSFKSRLLQLPRRLAQTVNIDWAARYLGGYSLLVVAKSKSSPAS